MAGTKLVIQLEMPTPEVSQSSHKRLPASTTEDRIRQAIELVDSGYCSDVEWLMLRRFYKALQQRSQTPKVVNLMKMIHPVLAKYGYFEEAPRGVEE